MVLLYMVTFTINISPMLALIYQHHGSYGLWVVFYVQSLKTRHSQAGSRNGDPFSLPRFWAPQGQTGMPQSDFEIDKASPICHPGEYQGTTHQDVDF